MRLLVAAALASLALSLPHDAPRLTVSAAISLTNVLEALAPLYRSLGGGQVRFNFGASNTLARQIINGAPVDVFISADEAQMKIVEDAGAVVPGSQVKLLGNTLVAVRGRGKRADGGVHALAGADYRRIAIGDPEAVPAGVYAKRWLTTIGLWPQMEPKLVPVASVRAVLAAVDRGGADAGFVYASDLAMYTGTRIETLASAANIDIVYPAAVLKASRHHAEAAKFVRFLCSAEAAGAFVKHKFVPLRCPRPDPRPRSPESRAPSSERRTP